MHHGEVMLRCMLQTCTGCLLSTMHAKLLQTNLVLACSTVCKQVSSCSFAQKFVPASAQHAMQCLRVNKS